MSDSLDAIFDGRIKVLQSRTGYRFSLDTLLLADFARLNPGETIVDLGAGNGVMPLILAERSPTCDFFGVELQDRMVERARKNVRLNDLQNRIDIVKGDVRVIERIAEPESFDMAVTNPPFRKSVSGRISVGEEKRIARHETQAVLGDFIRAAAYLLRRKGRLTIVYPAVRYVDLLTAMREAAIEPKRIRMVHSFVDSEAVLILAEGIKAGRAGAVVLAPLILYKRPDEYAEEALSIITGSRHRLPSWT